MFPRTVFGTPERTLYLVRCTYTWEQSQKLYGIPWHGIDFTLNGRASQTTRVQMNFTLWDNDDRENGRAMVPRGKQYIHIYRERQVALRGELKHSSGKERKGENKKQLSLLLNRIRLVSPGERLSQLRVLEIIKSNV